MNVREATIVGIFLMVGLGIHGYLSRPAQPSAVEQRDTTSGGKAAAPLSPQVLDVGGEPLVFIPFGVEGTVNWNAAFYRLEQGTLKKVLLE
jgi:hypothetical protein